MHTSGSPESDQVVVKRYRKPLLHGDTVPKAYLPPHHRELASTRLDSAARVSPIRPKYSPPSTHPLPKPCFSSFASQSHTIHMSSHPLPRPVHSHSRRSQPYPSEAQAHSNLGPCSPPPILAGADDTVRSPTEPRPAPHLGTQFGLQRDRDIFMRRKAMTCWSQVKHLILPFSPILQSVQASQFADLVEEKMLSKFAETTILRYCAQILTFFKASQDLKHALDSITTAQCVDTMLSLHLEHSEVTAFDINVMEFNMTNMLKALRWLVNLTQIPFPNLYTPPLSSWSYSEHQHKESIPLPLYFMLTWETQILTQTGSKHSRYLKGCFLFAIWASLRFSDCQHVDWNSFAADSAAFRASSYRTKTCRTGTPFGIIWHGFLSAHRAPFRSWLMHWLALLDEALGNTIHALCIDALKTPDFIFAELSQEFTLLGPLTYHQTLSALRTCLAQDAPDPWKEKVDVTSFTLHSMKCTLLSFSAQLSASESSRAAQGHHIHGSVALYARDDVYPALQVQTDIATAVRSDWRPMVPQHRGAQCPQADIPVEFQPCDVLSSHRFRFLTSLCFLQTQHPQDDVPRVQIVSDDEQEPPSLSASLPKVDFHQLQSVCPSLDIQSDLHSEPAPTTIQFLTAPGSKVSHVLRLTQGSAFATCGALLPPTASRSTSIPNGNRLCLKRGCLNVFDHYR